MKPFVCALAGSLAGGQHTCLAPDSSAHSCRLTWRAEQGSFPSACSALTARTAEAQGWSAQRPSQLQGNLSIWASVAGMFPGIPVCTHLPLLSHRWCKHVSFCMLDVGCTHLYLVFNTP